MMQTNVFTIQCPRCGAGEMHPAGDTLLIRAFKVQTEHGWHSQCLVCAGYYDTNLVLTPASYDRAKGWFVTT